MSSIDSQITFCSVSDLQESSRFWGSIIGLPLIVDQGSCHIYRSGGDACLGFCERKGVSAPEGVILTIVTEDVEAWYQKLSKAGVDLEHAPRHNPTYGIHHFFARDPDGHRVEIQRFDDPNWNSRDDSGVNQFVKTFARYVDDFKRRDRDSICQAFHSDARIHVADRDKGVVWECAPAKFYTDLFEVIGSAVFETQQKNEDLAAGWINVSGRWVDDGNDILRVSDFFMARGALIDRLSVVWWGRDGH